MFITSLYITDHKISWRDGERESMMNILLAVKNKNPNLDIKIIVEENRQKNKFSDELNQLKNAGIEMVFFKDKTPEKWGLFGIVHQKLVLIDPTSENAICVQTSANMGGEIALSDNSYLFFKDKELITDYTTHFNELFNESMSYTE
ncbi:phospholipase D-like domain-containing protein [Candidatus Altiarchaeota archaeon]